MKQVVVKLAKDMYIVRYLLSILICSSTSKRNFKKRTLKEFSDQLFALTKCSSHI